jgi:hypothetical protein
LKREVKKLELKVNKLKKQAKTQSTQDNHSNMVKKLENERIILKIASQQQGSKLNMRKMKKVEYSRSVFLNIGMPHIKSGIDYKTGDKHNLRVNTRG